MKYVGLLLHGEVNPSSKYTHSLITTINIMSFVKKNLPNNMCDVYLTAAAIEASMYHGRGKRHVQVHSWNLYVY